MAAKTWTLNSGIAAEALRKDLTKAQERLADAVDLFESSVLSGAKLLDPVVFSGAVAVNVYHTLPWRISGWIVVGRTANAAVWDTTAGTNDRREYITLTSSAAVTVTLLVF
jgi:hypothetical protein